MQENRYAQHKSEIDRISREEKVDIGTACAMLRKRMGWHCEGGKDADLTAFTEFLNGLTGEEVRRYFQG